MATVLLECPICAARQEVEEGPHDQPGLCIKCGAHLVPVGDAESEPALTPLSEAADRGEPTTVYFSAAHPKHHKQPLGLAVWKPGDVILDLYEVKQVHEGGMGLVYRVRHRGWNMDLAVKSPRPQYFLSERGKLSFEREAETWVRLGLHPHIVTCFYVRRIDRIPRIFAEYVEGGSLSDWIRGGRLYAGGPEQALERILDLAIQLAWGLHYAHEQGLVHQDVKPGNVLLTPAGLAKVTDFGLAKAQAKAGMAEEPKEETALVVPADSQHSVLVSSGGMTPAYCSPEQAARQRLSRKTDIWSYGLALLEMFLGEVTWKNGAVADVVLQRYGDQPPTEPHLPRMPQAITELLQNIFRPNPDERPRTLRVVVDVLQEVYQRAVGQPYPREAPEPGEALADGLNNRAISLLDLGKQEEAEKLWEKALQLEVQHPESTYNLGLARWRQQRLSEDALVQQLREVCASHPDEWLPLYLLAQIHLEREDYAATMAVLQKLEPRDAEREEIQALKHRVDARQHDARFPLLEFRDYHRHSAPVTALGLTRDGRYAVSGSADWTLKLWEVAHGRCLRTIEAHEGPIHALSLSSDGRLALSASADRTLKYWDVGHGQCLQTLEGHQDQVSAVQMASGHKYALSGSWDGSLKLWEVATGRCIHTYTGHTGPVTALGSDPKGRRLISGGGCADGGDRDCTVRLWELNTGRCRRVCEGHTEPVTGVCLIPGAELALSSSWDHTLKLWDLKTEQCVHTLVGHAGRVSCVCLSPDGNLALSGGDDDTLRLWEIRSGKCLRVFGGAALAAGVANNEVTALMVSAGGRLALAGYVDSSMRLWRLDPDRASPGMVCRVLDSEKARATSQIYQESLRQAREALTQGDFVQAARRIRSARTQPGYGRKAEALEEWTGLYTRLARRTLNAAWEGPTIEAHRAAVTVVGFSHDGESLFSAGKDRAIRLWDVATADRVRAFKGHEGTVCSVVESAHGRHLLSASKDGTLKLWDTDSGDCVQTYTGHEGMVRAGCLTPDGRFVVSGGWDKTLRLWERVSGRLVRTSTGRMKEVTALALSADGRLALAGSLDHFVWLWDVAGGRCLRNFPRQAESITAVCLSNDARQTLAANRGRIFHLLDVAAGTVVRAFEGHTDLVTSVCFSADGRHALSGSADRTARLWEVSTGRSLRVFEGHAAKVTAVALSADGRFAVSGSEDKTLRLWTLDWELENNPSALWDEGARPYLENFLTVHTPYAAPLPKLWSTQRKLVQALSRQGTPTWEDEDFQGLLRTLGNAGYGWLHPEGVHRELRRLAADWIEPPPLG